MEACLQSLRTISVVENRSTILYGNTISKWNAFPSWPFCWGVLMDMEFHRWWSILLYRGHVPLSLSLYLFVSLTLSQPFRFHFLLSPRLCLPTVNMLIDPFLSIFLSHFLSRFSPPPPSFLPCIYPCSLYCSVTHKLKFRVFRTHRKTYTPVREYQNRHSVT